MNPTTPSTPIKGNSTILSYWPCNTALLSSRPTPFASSFDIIRLSVTLSSSTRHPQRRLLGQFPTWHSRPLNFLCSIPLPFGVPSCEATKGVRPVCDDLTDAEDDDVFAPSTPVCVCHLVAASCLWMTVPAPRCRLTLARVSYSTTNSLESASPSEPVRKGGLNLFMDEVGSSFPPSDASGVELRVKADPSLLPQRL